MKTEKRYTQLSKMFLATIVIILIAPISIVLFSLDILTAWVFEDKQEYQTDTAMPFGNYIARLIGV